MITRLGKSTRQLHFYDLLVIFKDNAWIMGACFAVVVSIVAVVSFSQPKMYETYTRILIKTRLPDSPLPTMRGMEETVSPQSAYDVITFFNSQQMIIRSTVLAKRVFERYPRLLEHPLFKNKPNPESILPGMITTEPVERTHILDIKAVASDPQLAADVANAVADTYTVYNFEVVKEAAQKIYDILSNKLNDVKKQVSANQQDLVGVAHQEELARPKDAEKINDSKITKLSEDLASVQSRRIEKEVILRQLRDTQARGGDFFEIPVITSNPVISVLRSKLASMEVERANLRESLKGKHPQMMAHEAQMESVNNDIRAEIKKIIASIENEYQGLTSMENRYMAELNGVKLESVKLQQHLDRYGMEATQVKVTERAYDALLNRLTEADVLAGLQANIVTILEPAAVPGAPFAPKIGMNLMFAAVFSLFLGVGLVASKEYLDTSIRTPEDIENLNVSILSLVPHAAESEGGRSSLREAFTSLRTALFFAKGDAERYVLLVTSGVPKEGKTSVVTNLGKTLASAGESTIVVDCDFRRPMLHNKFNIDRRKGGVTSLLMSTEAMDLDSVIYNVAPHLDVLPCGPIPPDPPKLLGTARMREIVEKLKGRYRWVIIDTPPVAGLSDARVLAPLCDAVCLVMRCHVLDRSMAENALQQMQGVQANVIGAVFNDVDFRSAYYTRYYQYGGYYAYYYTSAEEKNKDRAVPIVERFGRQKKKEDAAARTTFFDS